MSNLFEKAKTWLNEKIEAAAGETVTYTRMTGAVLTITAVVGRTVFASNAEGGARVQFGDRDYLIDKGELPGGPPVLGDRITHTIDGTDVTFEAQEPDTGEPHWRWSDPARTKYRVHVKWVAPSGGG